MNVELELTELALSDAEEQVKRAAQRAASALGESCPPELAEAVRRLQRAQLDHGRALDKALSQAVCDWLVLRGTPPEAA